jgi:BirA family transcriptional regulator, biotin operon repressor / biotin---[acetyl-CoA-carboxylase] ligase
VSASGFDVERCVALARARGARLGQPLTYVSSCGSTNDLAMAAARDGTTHGATFIADEQTAGRGRRGSAWLSPASENLTFSVLLRPELALERVSALTLAVGLAVRDAAARRTTRSLAIKWPNDVVASDRKLAGILVESQLVGRRVEAICVGIGVNVTTREFPDEIAPIATSLALLDAADLDRESLLVELLIELDRRVREYEGAGLDAMLDELRQHDALAGRRVSVDGLSGTARGIDASGALLVDDGSAPKRILSGHVLVSG